MMDYAQYQQQPSHGQHPHAQAHLQGAYPTVQNAGPNASAITSPPNQQSQLQQHSAHSQTSPILPSQTHQIQPQNPNQASHAMHPMTYPAAYGVPPQGMHPGYNMSAQQAALAATA